MNEHTGGRVWGRFDDITCRHCGTKQVVIETRLEAAPLGTFSIAGTHPKVVAREWPWMVCTSCGHESRGELED